MTDKPERPVMDTFEEVSEWYTAYLCGVLDAMAEFRGSFFASDFKYTIKKTVESIIKDAWVLERQ